MPNKTPIQIKTWNGHTFKITAITEGYFQVKTILGKEICISINEEEVVISLDSQDFNMKKCRFQNFNYDD